MPRRVMILISALAATAACTSPLGLDEKRCPCLPDYQCCAARCVPRDQVCPDALDAEQDVSTAGARDADVDAGAEAREDTDAEGREEVALDASGDVPSDVSADAPPDVASEADFEGSPPSWHTLGLAGLPDASVLWFEVQVASDGTPFLALTKLTPPGRARVTQVFRYDGVAWQQLGGDLGGTELPVPFVLAGDGTPYVLANGIYFFQDGAWKDMPELGTGIGIAFSAPGLGLDRSGRLYTLSVDLADSGVGAVRFNGTSWDQLGPSNTFGTRRRIPLFGFDLSSPYVALHDLGAMETEVRRFLPGGDWELVGGSVIPYAGSGSFVVAPDGTAYFAQGDQTLVQITKSVAAAWVALDSIPAPYNVTPVVPAIDLGPDDAPYVAYLGDHDPGSDIVPGPVVTRWDGSRWQNLPIAGLEPSVFDAIKLRIARQGERTVPYIAYTRTNQLVVKKFE